MKAAIRDRHGSEYVVRVEDLPTPVPGGDVGLCGLRDSSPTTASSGRPARRMSRMTRMTPSASVSAAVAKSPADFSMLGPDQ
jgi:hypothetical protein